MEKAPEHLRKFDWYLSHQAWLMSYTAGTSWHDSEGAAGRRASLVDADLRGSNLSGADLRGAELRGADLSGADLSGANLSSSDLRAAKLRGSVLSRSNLWNSVLDFADLREAKLVSADLCRAYFKHANLSKADLRCANLRVLNEWYLVVLDGCNFEGAELNDNFIKYIAARFPAEYLSYALSIDNQTAETSRE